MTTSLFGFTLTDHHSINMKLISLNAYGGIVFEPLMDFVRNHADADVFCFQEMIKKTTDEEIPFTSNNARTNLFQEIERALPDFNSLFAPVQNGFDTVEKTGLPIQYGNATFVRKNLNVTKTKDFFIYGKKNTVVGRDYSTLGTNAIAIQIEQDDRILIVVNLHGTSEPAHKLDTTDRIAQSEKVLSFLADKPGEKIIVGDFNLFPDTESIRMFEEAGFKNLINAFDIQTTRGSMNKQLHPEFEHGKYGWQEYADYTFVTPGIEVESFTVPDEPISDHLPMILQIK